MTRADAADCVRGYAAHARAMLDAGFPLFIDADVRVAFGRHRGGAQATAAARAALSKGLQFVPAFARQTFSTGGNPFGGHAAAVARRLPPEPGPGPRPPGAPDEASPDPGTARRMVRAALTFQDLYVGLRPDAAPNVFSLLHAIELGDAATDGIYYPKNGGEGFGAVAEALADHVLTHPNLQEALFGAACTGVTRDEARPRVVTGIRARAADGAERLVEADAVVVSGYAPLLPRRRAVPIQCPFRDN